MNYEEAVNYIFDIPKFTTKNSPEITRAFLEKLGDISEIIPTIHVAGTNGKGSVCAYLRYALNSCGLKVGCFTSPHLVDVRERFAIDNRMISKKSFLLAFNDVMDTLNSAKEEELFKNYHPTFFEFLFFMAVSFYKKEMPDVLILETGLGGRLDATNSIRSPKICIITEIGFDHMEYLGNTKELIAGEKAGIIKRGVPVVFFDKEEGYGHVISKKAESLDAPCYCVKKENIKFLKTNLSGIDFSFYYRYDDCAKICLNTRALYQSENASLAFLALKTLENTGILPVDEGECLKGFSKMKWPGRMEQVSERLFLDGAHNEDGIVAFLDSVASFGKRKSYLLYSAVSDKQVEEVGELILKSGLFEKMYICVLNSKRACSMERLKKIYENKGIDVSFFDSVKEGMEAMNREADEETVCYVAGSLYLVGEVKELL